MLPRQLFEVAIQAAVGTKVLARETLSAVRKDVTAGLYGGEFHQAGLGSLLMGRTLRAKNEAPRKAKEGKTAS